jgi:acetyl-CoA C-acetyltransferase
MKQSRPVIVGVGQYTQSELDPLKLNHVVDLSAEAARNALADAGAVGDLAGSIDTLAWVRTFGDCVPQFKSPFKTPANPPGALAKRLGIHPRRMIHGSVGGHYPQKFVNEMAGRIARGEIEVALLAGAEAIANEVYAAKNSLSPDWSEPVDGRPEDRGPLVDAGTIPIEIAHGLLLNMPVAYSLFENGYRHKLNRSYDEHHHRLS